MHRHLFSWLNPIENGLLPSKIYGTIASWHERTRYLVNDVKNWFRNMMWQKRHSCFYFGRYKVVSNRWNNVITAFLTLTSVSSIAAWAIWSSISWLWAILIAASQILSAVRHLFSYPQRILLSSYLIPKIESLCLDIESEWRNIRLGVINDTKISSTIHKYEKLYLEYESQFAPIGIFPQKKQIGDWASKMTKEYFDQKNFNIGDV